MRTGVARLDLWDMADIAARYDTPMARALLRALAALGVRPAPGPGPRAYRGVAECIANRHSPMDRRR